MYVLTPFDNKNYDIFDAFHDFGKGFFGQNELGNVRTDIKDEGDKFVMEAELPGFDKSDIKIDVNDDTLTLSAEHTEKKEEKDKDNDKYICRERTYGSYTRSFDVSNVDTSSMNAKYENGVLTVNLPKKQAVVPTTRRIDIA